MVLVLFAGLAHSAPGAHGPNGEHLDAPTGGPGVAAGVRMEARTELFELVATLGGGEFSIMIDRFDSNQPVLNATVQVETGALKAQAVFHADIGDYAVDDPAFLKLLATPGTHALVFIVKAGVESDLLDGTLTVAADAPAHLRFDPTSLPVWLAGAVLAVAVIWFALRGRRRKISRSEGVRI